MLSGRHSTSGGCGRRSSALRWETGRINSPARFDLSGRYDAGPPLWFPIRSGLDRGAGPAAAGLPPKAPGLNEWTYKAANTGDLTDHYWESDFRARGGIMSTEINTPANKPPDLVEVVVEHDGGEQDRGMWLPIMGIWVIEDQILSDEQVSGWHRL